MKSLSIIIPCLNEQDSIPFCLKKIKEVLEKENIEKTEVIVVDNVHHSCQPAISLEA